MDLLRARRGREVPAKDVLDKDLGVVEQEFALVARKKINKKGCMKMIGLWNVARRGVLGRQGIMIT